MNKEDKSNDQVNRCVSRIFELAENDPQIGALMPIMEVKKAACRSGLSCDEVISAYLDGYADRPALGERSYDVISHGATGRNRIYKQTFDTITYHELHDRVKALAMAWRTHDKCKVNQNEFVCIIGFASIDFAIIDIACAYAKAVTVPLSSSSPYADIKEILNNVQPFVLASSVNDLTFSVEQIIQQRSVKSLIVFDFDSRVDEEIESVKLAKARLKQANVNADVLLLNDLIEYGKQHVFSFIPEYGDNEKTAMIIHSSGSTGKPKGACISERALINTWRGQTDFIPVVTLIMAPFNHNLGRNEMYNALNSGGTAYFTLKQDMSTLFEDIRLVRPTSLVFIPRVLEVIHQYFQIEVARRLKQTGESREKIEIQVKSKMKYHFLGDRLLSVAVASAPVSSQVRNFIEECFDVFLVNGYSTTETASGGLAINGKVNRHIVIDYKLKDVPELGYFTTDKPFPRGEFCVKTQFGITQYYNQPDATAQFFDEEGYALTGDIVEEFCQDSISIVDRKTRMIKLSQGEYVSLGTLGKVFEGGSALIKQIFVYGCSQKSHLLAVVVPNIEVAREMLNGIVTDSELKELIKNELHRVARENNLRNFEVPRDFVVEKEQFSQSNGTLSSVGKYIIPKILNKYESILSAMYENLNIEYKYEIAEFNSKKSSPNIRAEIAKLLKIVLKTEVSENDELKTFYELGGDSLSAVLFSLHIEEKFGVSIGGDQILNKQNNISQWIKMIDNAQCRVLSELTFDSIHGPNAKVIHSDDLKLERFIGNMTTNESVYLTKPCQAPRVVLLTGANGFLGHMVCLKLLEELSKVDGKLICIVRAQTNAVAKKRLDEQFVGVDARLENQYCNFSDNYLEVLAGDISKPSLGLDGDTFERLSCQIDKICHVGALVNHSLSYRHLFDPNVRGTCELILLAISQRLKGLEFISTIGVNELCNDHVGNVNPVLRSSIELSDEYASGYIATKWASEHLLFKANKEFGIPVSVFRSDIIMPSLRYKGQFNSEDFLTRLIFSIMVTGLAPESFYPFLADGKTSHPHFTGIPVDVMSDAIVSSTLSSNDRYIVYNAFNYIENNITLDSFVDGMERIGVSIKRVHKLDDWRTQVAEMINNVSQKKRRHTIYSLSNFFSKSFVSEQAMPDSTTFRSLVRAMYDGKDIPFLSDAYIHGYLRSVLASYHMN